MTPAGREMLSEFDRLGIIHDVTHLAEPGFFEAFDCYSGPVMASHTNCRQLVPGDRQFSDEQLGLLIQRDAVIGGVLDAWMLMPGWQRGRSKPEEVGLAALADHIDYICQLAGNVRHVALGTDLDGGFGTEQTPGDLKRYRDIWGLADILRQRGYSDDDIKLMLGGNFKRMLQEIWTV